MRRSAAVAVVLVVVSHAWPAAAGPAEEGPSASTALARLHSDDPKEVAWGAWLAAEQDLSAARAPLCERLHDATVGRTLEGGWFLHAVLLDAAIRLRALPSRDVLVSLARAHDAAVPTLVIRDARTPAATLLALFDRYEPASVWDDEAWLALGNHMHRLKTPGFAARVMRRLKFHRRLQVWDRHGPYPPYRPPGGSVPGHSCHNVPPGYPPIAVYHLELDAGDGVSLLAAGPRSVYAGRYERRDFVYHGLGSTPNRVDCRLAWIDAWFAQPRGAATTDDDARERVGVLARTGVIDFRYTGRQPWVRELTALQSALHDRYWGMVRELMDLGLVREIEAVTLAPVIAFDVVDERTLKRRALPAFPALRPRNPWRERRRHRHR